MNTTTIWRALTVAQAAVARQQAALARNEPRALQAATTELADALARVERELRGLTAPERVPVTTALRALRAEMYRVQVQLQLRLSWMHDWQRRVTRRAVW